MTQPTISEAAQELYDALSPTWADQDADNGWSLAYFCEALCASGLQPVYDYAFDDGARLGWTKLLDLNLTPDNALPYLAQFVGVQLPAGNTAAQNRALITSKSNWNRGTPAALISAVQATLIGSKRATLLERDTSPYHATLSTYAVQTNNHAATDAAIAANKPAGMVITHTIITSANFTQVAASVAPGTFAQRKLTYPTFGDVLNYVP